jgi:hypothetical protein
MKRIDTSCERGTSKGVRLSNPQRGIYAQGKAYSGRSG